MGIKLTWGKKVNMGIPISFIFFLLVKVSETPAAPGGTARPGPR